MNREKLIQQARVLRKKKLQRIAKARPTVNNGIVQYNTPIPQKSTMSPIPPPNQITRSLIPKQQNPPTQQIVQPQTIKRRVKGCAGCRRTIKKS